MLISSQKLMNEVDLHCGKDRTQVVQTRKAMVTKTDFMFFFVASKYVLELTFLTMFF